MRFRGKEVVFVLILSTLMSPTEMLVIPWFVMSAEYGWTNTYWGIMFPGLITGFGVFLLRQFFQTLPMDLFDAGKLDGLSEWGLFWRVGLPLVGPGLSALGKIGRASCREGGGAGRVGRWVKTAEKEE